MASVVANVALDMTSGNLFADFLKSLLASGSKLKPNVEDKSVTVFLKPNKKGVAETITFYSDDGFKNGPLKLPTGKTIQVPLSGEINDIAVWQLDTKTKKYTVQELGVYDVDLKIGDVLKVLKEYDPKNPTDFKDVLKAANKLYSKLFDGNDVIRGSSKNDILKGFDGKDKIFGSDGSDTLWGDAGNDWLTGGKGADKLEGGGLGSDWASYLDAGVQKLKSGALTTRGVTADLKDSGANKGDWAKGDKYGSIENLQGSRYDDKLFGDGRANILAGDLGKDELTGAGGVDMFVFNDAVGDKVLDFRSNEFIGLDEDYFTAIGSVPARDKDGWVKVNPDFFHVNNTGMAEGTDDRLIFDADDGRLYYDPDGSTGSAGSQFVAELKGVTSLSAGQIRVVDIDLL